jgi:hypothetical protein
MIVCRNCGAQSPEGRAACASCGASLAADTGWQPGRDPAAQAGRPGSESPTVRIPTEPSTRRSTYTAPIAPTPAGRPGLVRCTTCNTANPPSRGFCQKCGSRLAFGDPLEAGVASRFGLQGDGGDRRRLILIGGAALAAILVAGLVFGGFLGGGTARRSPSPSLVAGGSPSARPSLSAAPSSSASSAPSGGASASARPRFSCEPATVTARTPAGWTIEGATWRTRGRADRLVLAVARGAAGDAPASVTAEVLPVAEVTERGLEAPADGDRALVLTFAESVALSEPIAAAPELDALRTVDIRVVEGRATAVIGVAGDGCFGVGAPAWSEAQPPADGELVFAIRRP